MGSQRRVWHVVERYMEAAEEWLARQPRRVRHERQSAPVPRDDPQGHRRASGCRCRTTATARRTSTSPRPRRSGTSTGARASRPSDARGSPAGAPASRARVALPAWRRSGFIGLGIMGSRMAANLRRAGFELTVYNRTRGDGRAAGPASTAREVAASPAERSPSASDVSSRWSSTGRRSTRCCSGPRASSHGARRGPAGVDCSTISPPTTRAHRRGARRARRLLMPTHR